MGSRGITIQEGKDRVKSVIEILTNKYSSIRGNRVVTGLIEDIIVEAYNSTVPLKQVAKISVNDNTSLAIKLWDSQLVKNIEKAVSLDSRGFSVRVDGTTIYVQSPPLTEERRKEYVKIAKDIAEEMKQSLRNIRHKMIDQIDEDKENKLIGEDQHKRNKEEIEKLIKSSNEQIDEIFKSKEKDLMTV